MRQQKERSNNTHLGKGHPHTATHTPPRFFIITGSPWTVQSSSSCWCLVSFRIWCHPVLATTTQPVFFDDTHILQTHAMSWKAGLSRYLPAMRFFACPESPSSIGVRYVFWSQTSELSLKIIYTSQTHDNHNLHHGLHDGQMVSSMWESPYCCYGWHILFPWYVSIVVILITMSILLPV